MSRERQIPPNLFSPGVSLLPEDFPARLTSLKEITGMTWEGMSVCLGVDPRQLKYWRDGGWPNGGDQRQLLLPVDDNYSCRSSGVTIWYRRYRIGHRSAGIGTEAEANGRQESASVGRSIGDERADGTDVADRQAAIGEEGQETVANSTGPVRRGMGRGG